MWNVMFVDWNFYNFFIIFHKDIFITFCYKFYARHDGVVVKSSNSNFDLLKLTVFNLPFLFPFLFTYLPYYTLSFRTLYNGSTGSPGAVLVSIGKYTSSNLNLNLMVISFLRRRCHPVTRYIKKIADQPCYNAIFYLRRTEHKY